MQWTFVTSPHDLPKKPGLASYEHVYCLVIYKGEPRILAWNCEHDVWDSEDGDDFFCEPRAVEAWLPLDAVTELYRQQKAKP